MTQTKVPTPLSRLQPSAHDDPVNSRLQHGRPQYQSSQTQRVCSVSSRSDEAGRLTAIHSGSDHGHQAVAGRIPRPKKKMGSWRDSANRIMPGR